MIVRIHVQGGSDYDIGDEIWQQSLLEALTAEAETIAGYAGSDVLASPDQPHRAPDGVRSSLSDESAPEPP